MFIYWLWSLHLAKTVLHIFYSFPIYKCAISQNIFFFDLYWWSNFATRGNRAKGLFSKPLFSHQNFVQLLLPIRKTKIKKDFQLFWAGFFSNTFTLTLNWCIKKFAKNRIFCHVFFIFLQYLVLESVPKYLGLFEHFTTFQFTICYNWSCHSFFNGK